MGIGGLLKSAVHAAENIFHKAENDVKKTVKTVEKQTAKQISAFVGNVASQVAGNNPISQAVHTAQHLQQAIKPKSKGFLGNLLNAGSNLVNKVGNFGNNLVNKVGNFGNNLIEKGKSFLNKAVDVGAKVLDFGKKAVTEVVKRGLDIGRSGLNIITEGIGGLGRSFVEGAGKALSGLGNILNPAPLAKLFSGDFKGALNDIKNNFVEGAEKIGKGLIQATVQGPFDTLAVALQNGISAVQTAIGVETPGRGLNAAETAELKKVYGDSMDLSQIRIKENDIGLNNLMAPHTVGNTIYLPKGWLDPKSTDYQQKRNELIVHEAAHSWQYQNGGTDYIGESLFNQFKGWASGGDRNEAYDFASAIKAGKSWAELNPEQQAHLIDQAYGERLFDDPNAKFILTDGTDITRYARQAIEQMRNGKGAA
jgi:hypothetical protein